MEADTTGRQHGGHFFPATVGTAFDAGTQRVQVLAEKVTFGPLPPAVRSPHKPHRTGCCGDIAEGNPGREELTGVVPRLPVVAILMPAHVGTGSRTTLGWRFAQQLDPPDLDSFRPSDPRGQVS